MTVQSLIIISVMIYRLYNVSDLDRVQYRSGYVAAT